MADPFEVRLRFLKSAIFVYQCYDLMRLGSGFDRFLKILWTPYLPRFSIWSSRACAVHLPSTPPSAGAALPDSQPVVASATGWGCLQLDQRFKKLLSQRQLLLSPPSSLANAEGSVPVSDSSEFPKALQLWSGRLLDMSQLIYHRVVLQKSSVHLVWTPCFPFFLKL